jgi:hypothetical protein
MNNRNDMAKMSESVPSRLKIARIARGYSNRSQFAKACGAGVTTYRAHERGDYEMKASDIIRYTETLAISARWLLTGRGHPLELDKNPDPEILALFLYHLRLENSKDEIKQQIADEVVQMLKK